MIGQNADGQKKVFLAAYQEPRTFFSKVDLCMIGYNTDGQKKVFLTAYQEQLSSRHEHFS